MILELREDLAHPANSCSLIRAFLVADGKYEAGVSIKVTVQTDYMVKMFRVILNFFVYTPYCSYYMEWLAFYLCSSCSTEESFNGSTLVSSLCSNFPSCVVTHHKNSLYIFGILTCMMQSSMLKHRGGGLAGVRVRYLQ